jgi:hypothetical protein
MPHWLEEAEKKRPADKKIVSQADRIKNRYLRIQENVAKNGKHFDDFTKDLHELVARVNSLPDIEDRPFNRMESREKDSKLINHLNIFSGSKRIIRPRFWGLLPFIDSFRFKHLRVLFINISGKDGMCEIELKENILLRETIGAERNSRRKNFGKSGRLHVIYPFPINKLDHEMALEIIDWLAFSKEIAECTFYSAVNEDLKRHL